MQVKNLNKFLNARDEYKKMRRDCDVCVTSELFFLSHSLSLSLSLRRVRFLKNADEPASFIFVDRYETIPRRQRDVTSIRE